MSATRLNCIQAYLFLLLTGYGTFTTREFAQGDFLLQYRGEIITHEEGEHRQENYPVDKGSFLFFFQDKGGKYW